jgi:hypothetical protein
MKTIQSFFLIALIAIVAVGCGKVEKILPKKDGVWKVTKQEYRSYENDVLQLTETDITVTSYTFKDDGSGTYLEGGVNTAFTWSINSDNDKITLCQDFLGVSICFTYDILESSGKAQEWFLSIVDGTSRDEYNVNLERE